MNGILMAVVGFFIGGVANLVSAAISADLGIQCIVTKQGLHAYLKAHTAYV